MAAIISFDIIGWTSRWTSYLKFGSIKMKVQFSSLKILILINYGKPLGWNELGRPVITLLSFHGLKLT